MEEDEEESLRGGDDEEESTSSSFFPPPGAVPPCGPKHARYAAVRRMGGGSFGEVLAGCHLPTGAAVVGRTHSRWSHVGAYRLSVDPTGCHRLASATTRPARVVTPGDVSLGTWTILAITNWMCVLTAIIA
jgi:hypothetical protein